MLLADCAQSTLAKSDEPDAKADTPTEMVEQIRFATFGLYAFAILPVVFEAPLGSFSQLSEQQAP